MHLRVVGKTLTFPNNPTRQLRIPRYRCGVQHSTERKRNSNELKYTPPGRKHKSTERLRIPYTLIGIQQDTERRAEEVGGARKILNGAQKQFGRRAKGY